MARSILSLALRRRRIAALLGFGAAVVVPHATWAQSAPPALTPSALGQIVPPTRSDIDRLPSPERVAPKSRLTVSGGIERAPCALDGPRFSQIHVPLKRVVFDDLGPIDPALLEPAYRADLGHDVPVSTICDIRDTAATILRHQGYLAAIQVPPQRIEDGTIHFSVLLAKLVAVHVRGNPGHAEKRIVGYLRELQQGKPFNQKVAERALLLAGDLPGFDIHLTLRSAGTVAGEVVGDITVTRTAYTADFNVQNYGSNAVGRWSGFANFQANDVLGLGDRLVFGVYNTAEVREQTIVQGAYEIRPGNDGLILAVRGTYARTRPAIGEGDPVVAHSAIATVEASYPLVRRQLLSLRTAAGLDIIGQRLRFSGLPFTDDQLRVAYARIDVNAVDPRSISSTGLPTATARWTATGSLELRQGLGALGASRGCGSAPVFAGCLSVPSISRFDADPQATLLRLSGTLIINGAHHLSLALSPRAQVAFEPLLSFEQFSGGNYTVGRGYDPGALNGDNGVGLSTEVRMGPYPVPHLPRLSVQPFVFVDAARTWTLGPTPSVYAHQKLVTLGGGARLALPGRAVLELTIAKPVGPTPLPGQDHGVRLLLSLSTHFAGGR